MGAEFQVMSDDEEIRVDKNYRIEQRQGLACLALVLRWAVV